MMRVLLLAAGAVLVGGFGTIRSGLEIEPGASFVLGGEQRGAFVVDALNIGPVGVAVAEILASGDTVRVAILPPGESARVRFSAGSAALIVNRSARSASLDLTVTGDTRLGMRYTPDE